MSAHWTGILFYVAVGAVVVLLITLSALARRRRARALAHLCAQRGWRFLEHDLHDRPHRLRALPLFQRGHSRVAYHIVQIPRRPFSVECFSYRYVTGSGKHRSTHHRTVAVVITPIRAWPLSIRPERWHHKVADALGGEDIDMESHEFSRRYWVQCTRRRFAYDILNARMVQWFLDQDVDGSWEWTGDTLIHYWNGTLDPPEVVRLLDRLDGFVAHLPRHLVKDKDWARVPRMVVDA